MYRETKDEEAQSLAAPSAVPVPIRYADLWKAAKTWEDAFEFDPLMIYVNDGEKQSLPVKRMKSIVTLLAAKRRGTTLTVNNGSAFVVALLHLDADGPKPPIDRLVDYVITQILEFYASNATAEQNKRVEEVKAKMVSLVKETVGDRASEMVSIELLATEPASQGRGYGGALVEAINDIADLYGKASWLMALPHNEAFYNSHGYQTAGKCYIGEGNPNWTEKSVIVNMMVRETRNESLISHTKKSFKLDLLRLNLA